MQEFFKNFGLSRKETEVFLKLLELGAQPASVIARHVGIPRSSMYLVLDELKKLKLIEEFDRATIKYFKCIPAKQIAEVIRAKERKLETTFELFQSALPEMEKLENKLSITPKIKFFEGSDAVMEMYEEILQEREFYAMFHPEKAKKIVPEYYRRIPKMLREKKGSARELVCDCEEAKAYRKENDSPYHRIKILPKEIILESDSIICCDRLYLVSYGDAQISATEIYSPSMAHSQRAIFEYLWQNS